MSSFATEYGGSLQDLDALFKSGSGTGTTYLSQEGQDLAQRYAPFTTNKLAFDTGFVARDGRDLRQWFEAKPPQADLTWSILTGSGASPTLPPHAPGDMIVVMANRESSSNAPTLAAGFTNAASQGASVGISARAGYKIAQSSAESGGTWTNATSWQAIVISGTYGVGFVDATASNAQWPANTVASPGRNIGLHLGFSLDDLTPHPEDTPLFDAAFGTRFGYSGYTGLVSTLAAAGAGSGTNRMAGFTLELQPLQAFVPEMVANTAILNEAGGTVPLPPHQAGDLIIVAAGWRNDSAPAIPGGANLLPLINSSNLYVNGTLAYKVAASSAESAGVWGNDVTTLIGIVIKGTDGIGAKAFNWYENTGAGSRVVYPALTLQKPGQSGILTVAFSNNQGAANVMPVPASLQSVANLPNITQSAAAAGSTNLFDTWGEVSLTALSNVNVGFSIELFVTGAPAIFNGTLTPVVGTNPDNFGFRLGQYGSWVGAPALERLQWQGGPGVERTYIILSPAQQFDSFHTLELSFDGQPPVTFTFEIGSNWYATDQFVNALAGFTAGVPVTVELTGGTSVVWNRAAVTGYSVPAPPPDQQWSSTPITYKMPPP